MNSGFTSQSDLYRLASRLKAPLRWVGFKNQIPKRLCPGFGYIVNLQSSDEGFGTHWVCFYLSKFGRQAAYFDSFGAVMPIEVEHALKNFKVYSNSKIIQNLASGYCGQYCLFFIHFMSNHENKLNLSELMKVFKQLWSARQKENLGRLRENVAEALAEAQ